MPPPDTPSPPSEELVVLVDPLDRQVGVAGKQAAHRDGLLHRAFSIFVFNARGETLLQRRAAGKYHSPGLWSNSCCSHPRPGETPLDAAHRRLGEELGFDCALEPAFSFIYRASLDAGLTEHELDHVFTGEWSDDPVPNVAEVDAWRWVALNELRHDVGAHPDRYTVWLRIALDQLRRV
ncbi:MAG: isopentenyl-diphosphate Delta-isomerase [Gemmatimonadaceae bacterium]